MTPINLFCSDLDGTLLGDPASARRFKRAWETLSRRYRPLLCYNSGRLVGDILGLLQTGSLPWPDYIIGGQFYDVRRKQPDPEFDKQVHDGWDLAKVEQALAGFPRATRQPPEFQHPYKSSWYLARARPEMMDRLRKQLAEAGLKVSVVYSSGRDLDVLPAHTGKGHALHWLCKRIGLPLKQVLVAGDSGNDIDMFLLPEVKGIVMKNTQPELHAAVARLPIYRARRPFASGVLQGLAHFLKGWKSGASGRAPGQK